MQKSRTLFYPGRLRFSLTIDTEGSLATSIPIYPTIQRHILEKSNYFFDDATFLFWSAIQHDGNYDTMLRYAVYKSQITAVEDPQH
jgi:hypothetical protein